MLLSYSYMADKFDFYTEYFLFVLLFYLYCFLSILLFIVSSLWCVVVALRLSYVLTSCVWVYSLLFEWNCDHRDLRLSIRRQRQIWIRDSTNIGIIQRNSLCGPLDNAKNTNIHSGQSIMQFLQIKPHILTKNDPKYWYYPKNFTIWTIR